MVEGDALYTLGRVDSEEEPWYNHGTVTILSPSLGGRRCWQHPHGTGVSFSTSLPITGSRFNALIRATRRPTTMTWWRKCWIAATQRKWGTSNTAACSVARARTWWR